MHFTYCILSSSYETSRIYLHLKAFLCPIKKKKTPTQYVLLVKNQDSDRHTICSHVIADLLGANYLSYPSIQDLL